MVSRLHKKYTCSNLEKRKEHQFVIHSDQLSTKTLFVAIGCQYRLQKPYFSATQLKYGGLQHGKASAP